MKFGICIATLMAGTALAGMPAAAYAEEAEATGSTADSGDSNQIVVTVAGDTVRLDGKVRAWFERDVIERAAWAAPGVAKVDDHIAVGL